jgi:transposase
MKLVFEELWKVSLAMAEVRLFEWISLVKGSTLKPMKKVAANIERHWEGVIHWFESRITNGMLEGINSLIQAAKRIVP